MIMSFFLQFNGYFIAFGITGLIAFLFLHNIGTIGELILPKGAQVPILIVSLVFICFGVFASGVNWQKEKDAVLLQEAKIRDQIAKEQIDDLNTRLNEEIEKKQKVITVVKKQVVTKYIPQEADDACKVNLGFVRVHDSGATATPIQDSQEDVLVDSGIPLSRVGQVVKDNYLACNETATRYEALIKWVLETKKIKDAAIK